MIDYGTHFKLIREGKKISISKLAQKSMISKSQISRFERGESEISFSKIVVLLDSLNVSLGEYVSLFPKKSSIEKIKEEMSQVKSLAKSQDITSLRKKAKLLNQNSPEEIFTNILMKSIMHSVDENIYPSQQEIEYLTDYLFKIEFWTYYEIILLGNSIRFINLNTSFLLTKELLNSGSKYHSDSPYNKKMIIQLSLNCAIACIDANELKHANFLIKCIEGFITKEFYFFEKSILLYVKGYSEYRANKTDGMGKMNDALKVFEILDTNGIYKIYNEHFQKLTS